MIMLLKNYSRTELFLTRIIIPHHIQPSQSPTTAFIFPIARSLPAMIKQKPWPKGQGLGAEGLCDWDG